ncbi:MAG: 30S ribosomal protein S9 [Candidatus Pacearchaeota archaeon]
MQVGREKKEKKETKSKEVEKSKAKEVLVVSGKRKCAIARATIKPGEGIIKINNIPLEIFDIYRRLQIEEPLRIAQSVIGPELKGVDIAVNVKGGGIQGQTEAARLAIARALVAFTKSKELEKAFLSYSRSLVDADVRRKEMRKPRDSKARAKRQKSYR